MESMKGQKQKKQLIGPKNNQINFERILYASEDGDDEVLG